jgi:anti-sigma factor RsiW
MTLPRETVHELMALVDGQLEGEARARAEHLVATDDEARRLVEAMRASPVGQWVRDAEAKRSREITDIADAVMIRLGPSAVPNVAEGGVVRLAPRPRRRSGRGPAVVAGFGAALVLAAAIALYLRAGSRPPGEDVAPVASVVLPPSAEPLASASAAPGPASGSGVEVNQIEAPSRSVHVFEIPMGAAAAAATTTGHSSVVIWVEEDAGAVK